MNKTIAVDALAKIREPGENKPLEVDGQFVRSLLESGEKPPRTF